MSSRVYTGAVDRTNRPKFKVNKVINKFLIAWNIKLKKKVSVYYSWDHKRQPNMRITFKPFITVDFEPKTRTWHIGYFETMYNSYHGTIDDITGTVNISKIN